MRTTKADQELGTFEVVSGEVFVTDPCYDPGTWCQGKLAKVKKGIWKTKLVGQCEELIAYHESSHEEDIWDTEDCDIGVDSGQVGIFDVKHYENQELLPDYKFQDTTAEGIAQEPGERWYGICCDKTLSTEGAGVIPFGVVSSTAFGDGSYTCWTKKDNNDEIVGIRVDMYGPREDELSDDDYSEEE